MVTAGLWWALAPVALARPAAVGLFVGSNRAGPGQEPLRYAVEDAERFRRVMAELGGLEDGGTVLEDPDAGELVAALEAQAARLRRHLDQGDRTIFVFYYSGHARSRALTLGSSELPLHDLRSALEAMPSTVTVAVLDACQSGAISGVKGVVPEQSFSWSSTESLRAEGIAVMASSTANELSQESEGIGGSYFTHHLVTGLRGPADADLDGVVSLDEAYRYAYRETLVTTTPTRVGGQHATLETRLRGHGDLALTRPRSGTAWLELDGPSGRILATRAATGAVVAEVVQDADAPITLAVGAGRYHLVGTDEAGTYTCDVTLSAGQTVALTGAPCARSEPTSDRATAKAERRAERLGLEIAAGGLLSSAGGPFLDLLGDFGFDEREPGSLDAPLTPIAGIAATMRFAGRWSGVLGWSLLERDRWVRDWRVAGEATAGADSYRWRSSRLGLYARHTAPLRRDTLLASVQAGPGLTTATDTLTTTDGERSTPSVSGHLAAAAALHLVARGPAASVGTYVQIEGIWSPILRNEREDRRDVGGLGLTLGLRVAR